MAAHLLSGPALRRGLVALSMLFGGLNHPLLGQPAPDPVRSGERIYREGILPSGQPMSILQQAGSALSGTNFTCVGCHLRAGTGNADETGVTPPITAPRLFQERYQFYPNLTLQERAEWLPEAARAPLRRPAYTDATLVAAIRDGKDSAGHPLSPAMPRYQLTDQEAALLVSYLRTLSKDLSPGVTETALRFATVVTSGTAKADREAMLETLQKQVAEHNKVYERSLKKAIRLVSMKEMALPLRRWSLTVWDLTGPPTTWSAQMENYYQNEPVFALVGGITDATWRPIHEFCEGQGIPCILPLTEFPVDSPAGKYTLYFSGGFYQEGATAANRLASTSEGAHQATVIQVTQPTPQGLELSRGFRDAWSERGLPKVREILAPPEGISRAYLSRLLQGSHGNATLVLWADREAFPALEEVAIGVDRPAQVFMSAGYLGEGLWDLPQAARPITSLTYPYRAPKPATTGPGGATGLMPSPGAGDAHRVRSRTQTLMQVLDEGIRRMGRDFYRDNLMDRIGLMDNKKDSDFQVLRFGQGQPWLSTSCSLVRISPGSLRALLPEDGTPP